MGLLSTLFAFNFVVATPAIANEQRHGSKNNEPQNAQKFEHKPVQIVTQRHNHHHRKSSNYNNQYHHKNQHNKKGWPSRTTLYLRLSSAQVVSDKQTNI